MTADTVPPDRTGAARTAPRIALGLDETGVALYLRVSEGTARGWTHAGEAHLQADDFQGAVATLRARAVEETGAAGPALLWLPPQQILLRRIPAADAGKEPPVPGGPPEPAVAELLAGETPYAREDLVFARSPADGSETVTVLAALRQTWEEALGYAAAWGFEPAQVSTRTGAQAFGPDGPAFAPLGDGAVQALSPSAPATAALPAEEASSQPATDRAPAEGVAPQPTFLREAEREGLGAGTAPAAEAADSPPATEGAPCRNGAPRKAARGGRMPRRAAGLLHGLSVIAEAGAGAALGGLLLWAALAARDPGLTLAFPPADSGHRALGVETPGEAEPAPPAPGDRAGEEGTRGAASDDPPASPPQETPRRLPRPGIAELPELLPPAPGGSLPAVPATGGGAEPPALSPPSPLRAPSLAPAPADAGGVRAALDRIWEEGQRPTPAPSGSPAPRLTPPEGDPGLPARPASLEELAAARAAPRPSERSPRGFSTPAAEGLAVDLPPDPATVEGPPLPPERPVDPNAPVAWTEPAGVDSAAASLAAGAAGVETGSAGPAESSEIPADPSALAPLPVNRPARLAEAYRAARPANAGLDAVRLLGVLDIQDARQALLQLPDARVLRVSRGDSVEGWRVTAIDRDAVSLRRGEDRRTLAMPAE